MSDHSTCEVLNNFDNSSVWLREKIYKQVKIIAVFRKWQLSYSCLC